MKYAGSAHRARGEKHRRCSCWAKKRKQRRPSTLCRRRLNTGSARRSSGNGCTDPGSWCAPAACTVTELAAPAPAALAVPVMYPDAAAVPAPAAAAATAWVATALADPAPATAAVTGAPDTLPAAVADPAPGADAMAAWPDTAMADPAPDGAAGAA